MMFRLSLLCLLVGCRSGETDPSDKDDAQGAVDSGSDSASPWYDYEEDDGGDGSDDDSKDEDDDGKGDDGKGDDGDGGDDYDYEACPDDFNPDEPCEVEWEDGGICLEGSTIWYCVEGVWEYK